ncbi:hypothetical protein K8S19_03230 [bacterium]|nr:hypothetical protein [bacterium]
MQTIPASSDKRWLEILGREKAVSFKFIATKILAGRLRLKYKQDASPEKVQKYIEEFRTFFETNRNISLVAEDLATIIQSE